MILISLKSFPQEFSSQKDIYSNTRVVRYFNENSQMVIQKTVPLVTNSNVDSDLEIGLIVYRTSISRDEFMKTGSAIVFDDDSFLFFKDQVRFNFLYSGEHELSIKHKLSPEELQMLQNKKIKFFRILNYENSLDRWEKEKIRKVFSEILKE
jgi:hypothetical protein